MATKTAGVEVFTPRPRNDQKAIYEQLLTSSSSTDSTTADSLPPSRNSKKNRERGRVKFSEPAPVPKPVSERIKVDEVDDVTPPRLEETPSRSARSRSRSTLRNATGPRSASRPARRRALSRGRPISRETTDDQYNAPVMTADEIARELRPESFTRYKKITLTSDKQKASCDSIVSPGEDLGNMALMDDSRGMEEHEERYPPSSCHDLLEALSPMANESEWEQTENAESEKNSSPRQRKQD